MCLMLCCVSGKRSEEEVLREFLDTFDGTEKDGKVRIRAYVCLLLM